MDQGVHMTLRDEAIAKVLGLKHPSSHAFIDQQPPQELQQVDGGGTKEHDMNELLNDVNCINVMLTELVEAWGGDSDGDVIEKVSRCVRTWNQAQEQITKML